MLPEEFRIAAVYGEEEIHFKMRMISVEEENQYLDRLMKLISSANGKKDSEAEYRILVDALTSWLAETPRRKDLETGEMVLLEGLEEKDKAVGEYFKERTPAKERMVNQVLNMYRRSLVPDVHFL
jgi:hypothetical protein